MATTFNVSAFQTRVEKAADRARVAAKRSSEADQRVQKRFDRIATATAKAKKLDDDVLRTATVDKLAAEREMTECDRVKAAANAAKLAAYVRQLTREGELKAARSAARAEKAAKPAAVWGIRTVDGNVTPIQENDGSMGRLVGRSKKVEIPTALFAYLLGEDCTKMVADLDNVLLTVNELSYAMDMASKPGVVILCKVTA
jgi:hypothetical protein